MKGADNTWHWAHILWQAKGLSMEEFAKMERQVQLAYIASYKLEEEMPVNWLHKILNIVKIIFKVKGA